jgi:hypothetical protein
VKPYLYILAVLLVGGGVGYFIGQKSATIQLSSSEVGSSNQDDTQLIQSVLDAQRQAYELHDSLLLFKDCADSYVEIDANTGETRGLEKAVVFYHDLFKSGQSVTFSLKNPDIRVSKNSAVVKSEYTKTSEAFEQRGIKGLTGDGLWLLAKSNRRWQITAFCWNEEAKK